MDNKVLFRKAFQGFNKEDVVSYIDKISKDTNRMLAEKDADIKELTARAAEAEGKAAAAEERSEQLTKQNADELAHKQDEICELKSRIQQLEKELEENSVKTDVIPEGAVSADMYAALEEKYNTAVSEKSALAKQIEAYREFDGVQRDLGTIIIKSEKNAAEIIAKAKKDADNMINEAARMSDEITERRINACREIADTFDRSKVNMDEAHRTLCEKLDSIKSAIDTFYSSLEMGRKIVHENVDSLTSIKYETASGFVDENKI